MGKNILKTKGLFCINVTKFLLIPLFMLSVISLYSSQMDQNMVDDVQAMITNVKKLAHTTFVLDTSESMNTFAFSDYIQTCADSKANIDNAIVLCNNAYNQCRNVEANAMCDVNLGCGDILTKCQTLNTTKTAIYLFCADIQTHYGEPGKTTIVADPLGGGANDAKKYVGPWDPRRADYKLDICFYNWTEDTGGQVLSDQTSGHWTNPNGMGYTDRRDWDCLTDGIQQPQFRGGLWLNWKYSTSLDAIKIILGDTHDFSYPPTQRGIRECLKTRYKPVKNDAVLGKICYQEFVTDPMGPTAALQLVGISEQVRNNWEKVTDGIVHPDINCASENFTPEIATVLPLDPNSVPASAAGCDVCLSFDSSSYTWSEVPCQQYSVAASKTAEITNLNGVTADMDYTCCINYECSDPKCRDDDETCRASGDPCILGYYSDFDQDQNHCCDMLSCVENDPSGCAGGGTYLPGPGNSITVEFEKDLGMPVLVGADEYQNVELMAKVTNLSFGSVPANVDKVIVTVYYGCNIAGINPANKIGEKTFSAPVVLPGQNIFAALIDLSGCEQSGYKVGGTMELFHSGANFSVADVSMDLQFSTNYTSGSDADINVFNGTLEYYSEFINQATGLASDRVNEYECRTTFYHKQSLVVNGGSGNCPAKHPSATKCTEPDHTAIAKDQWGKVTKTACSWLCRDDAVYDDVWKCRAFFSQMDNPARGGSGLCSASCPGDNPATLEACCSCINSSSYNFKNLETPEYVWFGARTLALGGRKYNCSVSGYEEGITSDGKRTYTSAYMAEVIEGHIKELGDSSYRLTNAFYTSPYNLGTNKWYSAFSLLNRSNSFLKDSFTSVFETGKNDTRDIACIYDLIDNFEGEDCDDCGTGCCSISIGGGTDYCDYPNFWMKIPNTEGGQLIMPAKTLAGSELANFQALIKGLKAKGGSTLGETLIDVWRYLGGMKPAHDTNPIYAAGYTSPFISAPAECFINNTIIVSGGQPQFDDNYSIRTKTTQALPTPVPYVVPDAADNASPARPYVRANWYLTALPNIATFAHTRDYWHDDPFCRADNNVNIYGYEVGGITAGHTCTTATDASGPNVIDKIHTVAIGEWTLAPLYNNPSNNYLDTSVLEQAATITGGTYFGLTARAASASDPSVKTFYNLTDMFNAFHQLGSPDDFASGRPHWTASLTQVYDAQEKYRVSALYSAGLLPVDNAISRFWFGNLREYYKDDASKICNLENDVNTCVGWTLQVIPEADCFYETDLGTDISLSAHPDFPYDIRNLLAGGAAKRLEDKLYSKAVSCDAPVGGATPCFVSGARNVLYDDGTDMLELDASAALWFTSRFQLTNPTITLEQSIQILDYMYGYDAFDFDNDGARNQVRFHSTPVISVDDPFKMDFTGLNKVNIRPLLLGAFAHSNPIAVHYEDTTKTRIFIGANDGMFHSFDEEGRETFAYIPMPAHASITAFLDGRIGIFFNATVDGSVTLFHIDQSYDGMINEGEKAYIIFGYRRGGKGYTVIDVSELDKPKFVQHIPTEGMSFGKPVVFRKCTGVCNYANDLTYYLAVPGGYDGCQDEDVPISCPKTGGQYDPDGNEVQIYKFNNANGKFELVKEYKINSIDANADHLEWMQASFAAAPVVINTSASLAKDTEFVYFRDLTSTVFRIDVRDSDPANWLFRMIFNQRALPSNIVWTTGIRNYNSTNMYPPWEKYPSWDLQQSVPIPLATGNLANMKISEMDEVISFYDNVHLDHDPALGPVLDSSNLKDIATDNTGNGTQPWPLFDGWKNPLIHSSDPDPLVEKNVVDGLVRFIQKPDEDPGYWHYSNTYIPARSTECLSWGRTRNYRKLLVDGQEIFGIFDDKLCGFGTLGKPTAPNIIETDEGSYATFSAGGSILIEEEPIPKPTNITNIIKWYELY